MRFGQRLMPSLWSLSADERERKTKAGRCESGARHTKSEEDKWRKSERG